MNKCTELVYSRRPVSITNVTEMIDNLCKLLERESRIEKDNLNLLQKLEDIKRKGTVSWLRISISNIIFSVNYSKKKTD